MLRGFKIGAKNNKHISLLKTGLVGSLVAGFAVAIVAIATAENLQVKAAPTLADGFTVQDMPSGQSQLLTDFSFAPDGSYYTTGKNGRLAWVSATGEARTIAELPVINTQDVGLNSVAVSHDYETSRVIYTIRSLTVNSQRTTRLSAWTVNGAPAAPTSLSNERTIIQIPFKEAVHGMTTVLAPADGSLWVSIGDTSGYVGVDTNALKVLDMNEPYGKVLHIMPNGNGVPSNPYYSSTQPASWKSRVYASGFRSPFRMNLDPMSGAPILGDVGYNDYEEINIVRPGATYGWPCWEGETQTPGYKDLAACKGVGNTKPLWHYPHGVQGTSVTGGTIYTGNSYPAQYRGSYFFGDYSSRRVYTLKFDATGNLTRQPEANGFAVDQGLPVKFGSASNGDIIYADIYSSKLKRLVYIDGNRAPTAKASITNNASTRTVYFDASESTDLDGDAMTYRWDFGDGTTATGIKTSHTYAAPGTSPLTAKLTVTDTKGASNTASYTVVPANNIPKITLSGPAAGTLFKVDDTVSLRAQASDVEDGVLEVKWQAVIVHCSGGYCHDHPGDNATGPSYSQIFTDHGDDTRLEITATATDSRGAISQATYVANPKLRTLTMASNVPSAITVNGVASSTTQITVGARVSVVAPVTAADGVATFNSWSDGAARERTIVMPDADTRLTASYLTPIDRRYAAEAGLRTTLGAATAPETGDASLRYRDYANGRLYWTPTYGVHEIHGGIYRNFMADGGHVKLGVPKTDEVVAGDGRGRYSLLSGSGSTGEVGIYWHPDTGAYRTYGAIYRLWKSMGAEKSKHGYPTSNEQAAAKDGGRYSSFQSGRIYWTPSIGTRSVHGAIYAKWAKLGHESGILGYALTNEKISPDGIGRYTSFEKGTIFWTPSTGANEVHGAIRSHYQRLGWEKSYLGYPTSDEFKTATGSRSNFQGGYITWNSSTRQTYQYRY